MVLQHSVRYHKARDWIRHQDQSQLRDQAHLSHCKMLESWCEQFKKAKERGHANLASIIATTSSLHLDALSKTSKHCCKKYGYSHSHMKYPAKGQQCYACSGYNHFTALCWQRGQHQMTKQTLQRGYQPKHSPSSHCGAPHHTSCSPHRHQCRSPSHHSTSRTPSHSPSFSPSNSALPKHSTQSNRHLLAYGNTADTNYDDAMMFMTVVMTMLTMIATLTKITVMIMVMTTVKVMIMIMLMLTAMNSFTQE